DYTDLTSLQSTKVITFDSQGKKQTLNNYYPGTSQAAALSGNSSSLLNDLNTTRHNLELVFQKKESDTDVSSGYGVKYSDTGIPFPDTVTEYGSNLAEAKSFYILSRDDKGNILERVNDGGIRESYLWDYEQTLPVARIDNVKDSNFAYTSFEGSNNGNW